MKISDTSTEQLWEIASDTEAAVGRDAAALPPIRRELDRRLKAIIRESFNLDEATALTGFSREQFRPLTKGDPSTTLTFSDIYTLRLGHELEEMHTPGRIVFSVSRWFRDHPVSFRKHRYLVMDWCNERVWLAEERAEFLMGPGATIYYVDLHELFAKLLAEVTRLGPPQED